MSRNGSGTYSLPAGNPVVTGTTITTTWANTTLSDISSALTGSVAADGQTPMSGSLNMANNKVVSVLDPTSAQDAATKAYVDAADTTNLALTLLKANNLSDVASASTSRTNLGLGTIATQAANSVSITGGSITGITDLAVADGGTGSSTLSANAVLLGNGTSALQTIAPSTSGNLLTSNGTTWTSASPKTAPSYASATTITYNTVTQAPSDGVVMMLATGSFKNGIQLNVGDTSSVSYVVAQIGDDINSNTKGAAYSFPIKAGSYYKWGPWSGFDAFETITIYFFPNV